MADVSAGLLRPALDGCVPYEPGKPVEEVQRELGLERVVKLASNEGPFGPFPQALEALERAAGELNRYPDGGAYRLRAALAERHGVRFEEIAVGAGADGLIDGISQAALDPGDEIVCGWPSFPSYVLYAVKMGAVARKVPLQDDRYDLDAILAAVTARTKLVYLCHPNNPTGTMNTRAELDGYFDRVPEHVLTVLDQAYFEYIDREDYPDGIDEYFRRGRQVIVLRTFSKIYGLAGLRVGYGVGPAELVTAAREDPARVRPVHAGAGSCACESYGTRGARRTAAPECARTRRAGNRPTRRRLQHCRPGRRQLRLRRCGSKTLTPSSRRS